MQLSWKQKILAIWAGQAFSLLTSMVLQMALIWYLTLTTGSAVILTASTLVSFLPQALFGAFSGPFVDRLPKKVVLIGADASLAATSLLLAYLARGGDLPVWVILAILPVRSLCTSFHEPAAHSLTPLIVPPESITQYAGYAQAFDSICMLLSPALAILCYNHWELSLVLALDAIGAAVAISILLVIPFPKEEKPIHDEAHIGILAETKLGIAYLRQQEGLMALMIVGMLYSMIYAPIGSLYPHITMVHFGGSNTVSGIVETIFSAGTLLGALVLGRVAGKLPKLWGLIGSMFCYGLGVFLIGCLSRDGLWIFAFISFFVGMTTPFYHGIVRAIYQLVVPQEYLGRTFALSQSTKRAGMPLGLICGGILADSIGSNILMLIVGAMAMILALTLTRLPSLKRFRNL